MTWAFHEPVKRQNIKIEQLAILFASGKAKEMIGVPLSQGQVKKLSEQDVEIYLGRYEASWSSYFGQVSFWSIHVKWIIHVSK